MFKPLEIKTRPKYKLWIRYEDGVEGEVDLSHLAGKGVFKIWNDTRTFEKVKIGPSGEITWNQNVDLCPDSLYLQITQKTPQQAFENLKETKIDA